jgi:primosomal protein N'
MIIQAIPARRMPLSLPFLDYSIPTEFADKIKIGQLVKIPFRGKEEFGVVLDIKKSDKPNIKTKPINEIIFEGPILSKQQLNFLADIAEFYHVSLGFLLKSNLLPLQTRKLKAVSSPQRSSAPPANKPKKPQIHIHKDEIEKKEIILKKISTGQNLILVPELTAIKKITGLLPENILNRAITVTGELKNKELFDKWVQLWSGEKNTVIGTRTAIFLPWFNLKNIILTDEGNPNYKSWDMAPRFHARDAALFLSKHHAAELSFLSHTPSVESYYFAKNKVYDTKHDLQIKPVNKPLEIVDMKSERRSRNYSLISATVLEEFRRRGSDGDAVFFLNRRGTTSYVGCRDCGNILKCPKCEFSLTYHQDKNTLKCHYCEFFKPMPSVCETCKGVNVAMYGAGTQLAEELIKKITNQTADMRPIIRIDSDKNDLAKLKIEKAKRPHTEPPSDSDAIGKIIICTQLAWSRLNWDTIKLFVFLDADAPLFIPEYKIIENLWQQFRDAQYKLPRESSFLVQTGYPEHLVFKSLYNPDLFYSEQLAERRAMGYPPFKYLLKLISGNQKSAIIEMDAEKLKTDLIGLTQHSSHKDDCIELTKGISGIKILGPLETSPYHYGGKYWQVILAKIGYENYKKNIKLLLTRVPENWKIDPNPNSLLNFY